MDLHPITPVGTMHGAIPLHIGKLSEKLDGRDTIGH